MFFRELVVALQSSINLLRGYNLILFLLEGRSVYVNTDPKSFHLVLSPWVLARNSPFFTNIDPLLKIVPPFVNFWRQIDFPKLARKITGSSRLPRSYSLGASRTLLVTLLLAHVMFARPES